MAGETYKPRVTFLGKPHHNYGFPPEAFDTGRLPDAEKDFLRPEHLDAFIQALGAPDPISSSPDDGSLLRSPTLQSGSSFDLGERPSLTSPGGGLGSGSATPHRHGSQGSLLITAQNDWAPVNERVTRPGKRRRKRRPGLGRSVDEAREGYLYSLLRWPFLLFTMTWIIGLAAAYLLTRFYVWGYEHFVAWRGKREKLRRSLRATSSYKDWVSAAKELDAYLGSQAWKEENEYAYYDSKTVRRVWEQIKKVRREADAQEARLPGTLRNGDADSHTEGKKPIEELKGLVEACVKSNFVGVENSRLYSETYYGTKNLVQNFIDEGWFPSVLGAQIKGDR